MRRMKASKNSRLFKNVFVILGNNLKNNNKNDEFTKLRCLFCPQPPKTCRRFILFKRANLPMTTLIKTFLTRKNQSIAFIAHIFNFGPLIVLPSRQQKSSRQPKQPYPPPLSTSYAHPFPSTEPALPPPYLFAISLDCGP